VTLAQPITVIASLAGLIIVVAGLQLAVLGSRLDTHAERLGGRIDSLAERLGGRIDTLGAQVAAADTRLQDVAHDVRKIRDDVYEPVRRAPQQ
jgi:hypothetical protein